MFKEQIDQAVQVFQSLDGIEKAIFSFWGICAAMFYGILLYVVFLMGQHLFYKLFKKYKA
jgi:hypothetical protein